jgi:hypothetical protein
VIHTSHALVHRGPLPDEFGHDLCHGGDLRFGVSSVHFLDQLLECGVGGSHFAHHLMAHRLGPGLSVGGRCIVLM